MNNRNRPEWAHASVVLLVSMWSEASADTRHLTGRPTADRQSAISPTRPAARSGFVHSSYLLVDTDARHCRLLWARVRDFPVSPVCGNKNRSPYRAEQGKRVGIESTSHIEDASRSDLIGSSHQCKRITCCGAPGHC